MQQKQTPLSEKKPRKGGGWSNDFEVDIPPSLLCEQVYTHNTPKLPRYRNGFYSKYSAHIMYHMQRLVLFGVVQNFIIDSERDDITVAVQGTTGNFYYFSHRKSSISFCAFINKILKEESCDDSRLDREKN